VAGVNVQVDDKQPDASRADLLGQQDSPQPVRLTGRKTGHTAASRQAGSGFFNLCRRLSDYDKPPDRGRPDRSKSPTDDNKTHSAAGGADAKIGSRVAEGGRRSAISIRAPGRQEPHASASGSWRWAIPTGWVARINPGDFVVGRHATSSGTYNDFLQIDASINQGNSGGPTFRSRRQP